MSNRIGQKLGHYQLVRLLGRGGFAEVYLGEHLYLKRYAALKILNAQLTSEDLQDFLKEAQTIASLRHPNIINVLDFGMDSAEQTLYLVMDYAPNGTLRQRHPKGSILPLSTIVTYVKQVAAALNYAHEKKLIHCDIKPENMLLDEHGNVLLSDFGIAAAAHSTTSLKTQAYAGTVHYSAPEQIQGRPRTVSDQYALAVVVYEWLTGRSLFTGSQHIAIAMQHLTATPEPLRARVPTILPEIEQIVLTALSKEPEKRFKNIQAFAMALEEASKARTVGECLLTYRGHSAGVFSIAWSPDSTHIASISNDDTLQVWDTQTGKTLFTRNWERFLARTVAYSPDGTRIATPGVKHGQAIQIWNAFNGSPVAVSKSIGATSNYRAMKLVWSPNNKFLASINVVGQLYVWLAATGEELWEIDYLQGKSGRFSDAISNACVAWSPDGSFIAYGRSDIGWGDDLLHVVNATDGHELFTLEHDAYDVAWSPNGSYIAYVHSGRAVTIRDAKTGDSILTLQNPSETIAWSPDSSKLVSAGSQGAVLVWDVPTGSALFTYNGHSRFVHVHSAAWSPDGNRIASAAGDGIVQIWQAP